MKQKFNKLNISGFTQHYFGFIKNGAGFTLIELMVVITIMGLILSVFVANISGQQSARNSKIAQSLLVTNLRKIQSYTLSSRNVFPNVPAQYYLMKIELSSSTQYTIQAIYDVSVSPKLKDVEIIKLPNLIKFASSTATSPFFIDRVPLGASGNDQAPSSCVLIAFRAPFGKAILNNGCTFSNFVNDDYAKIKDFVSNDDSLTSSTDSILTIGLMETKNNTSKYVRVNAVNGSIGD